MTRNPQQQAIADMKSLGKKQELFARLIIALLTEVHMRGYQVRLGEVWRHPVTAAHNARKGTGIANSLHTIKLAIDIMLFKDGEWLKKSEDYEWLGLYWERLGGSWGGRFKKPDGGHFSLEHNGVR